MSSSRLYLDRILFKGTAVVFGVFLLLKKLQVRRQQRRAGSFADTIPWMRKTETDGTMDVSSRLRAALLATGAVQAPVPPLFYHNGCGGPAAGHGPALPQARPPGTLILTSAPIA